MSEFRLGQRPIIESVLNGNDVLAVMPTGGGKSLCYQLPAMVKEGLVLVVSPLIALMNDQVSSLKRMGIPCGHLHSGMSVAERKATFAQLKANKNFILYLSPERVQKEGFMPWLEKQNVSLFAIDEAHCVSQWGHDFRSEYSMLKTLREVHPNVPMIGLTATATPLVKKDIIEQLGLKKTDQHVYGFYRPNLYYQVEFCADDMEKEDYVLQALKQTPKGRVIIYCGTRKKAESITEFLKGQGKSVAFYHAGMSSIERTSMEIQYQEGKVRILAATNAFGMGVDHPDVRLVVHTQMPGNIESYYQEVGRAGRDGKPSTCLMAYSKKDKGLQAFFITNSRANKKIKDLRWSALDAMVNYSEGSECRHGDVLTYFKDEKRIKKCGHCDSCDPKSDRKIQSPPKERRRPSFEKKKRAKKGAHVTATLSDKQKWQMDVLRDWRKEYSNENDIPAFMVFSDKTLMDLIVRGPQTEEQLSEVYGFGDKKIEEFGGVVLEMLNM